MLQDPQISQRWSQKQNQLCQLYWMMIQQGNICLGDKKMLFQFHKFGQRPPNGYTLLFGLHGGGGCPSQVNQQQYINHLGLYNNFLPSGVIWVACRSCEESWDMWWKPYLPDFFAIIIRGFVLKGMVNPNKVFMSGYSAGGDGTYHLGPMLADWWAGAAMMAGHPNDTQLQNMRNCPFSIQMGGKDGAYNRNTLAEHYIQKMGVLHNKYGNFQTNYCNIFPECEHWMNLKDAGIWKQFLMETRNPYPELILFKQHSKYPRKAFYYLQVEPERHKQMVIVNKKGNDFYIQSQNMPVIIYINRFSVNFGESVRIFHNSVLTVEKKPQKNMDIIQKSIDQRVDPEYIFQDCLVSVPNCDRVPLDLPSFNQRRNSVEPNPVSQERIAQQIQQRQRVHEKEKTCCSVM